MRYSDQAEQNKQIILNYSDQRARDEIENLAGFAEIRLKDLQKIYARQHNWKKVTDKGRRKRSETYKDIYFFRELSSIYNRYIEYKSVRDNPQGVLLEIKMAYDLRYAQSPELLDTLYYSPIREPMDRWA